jgi:hypothetical protein
VATSVNTPANTVSQSARLLFDPFCDRQGTPGQTKVSTEYGCRFVCLNQTGDVRESSCASFGTFEPSGIPYNRTTPTIGGFTDVDYSGEYHCTGIGAYAPLNNYMDGIFGQSIQPFIPQQTQNTYFLPAPICRYVAAYGYHLMSGQLVQVTANEAYAYGSSPQQGTSSGSTPAPQPVPPIPVQNNTNGILLIVGAVVVAFFIFKRKV